MFKVQVIGIQSVARQLDDELRSAVKMLGNEVFTEVKRTTPVDTGRARSGWKKQVTDRSFEISNDVPYVPVLDKGRHMTRKGYRGSKQAPDGIVGPSLKTVKGRN